MVGGVVVIGAAQPGEADRQRAVQQVALKFEGHGQLWPGGDWFAEIAVEAAYPVIAAAVEARVRAETQAEIAVYQAQIGVSASRYVEKCEEVDLLEERIAELEARA